MNIVLGTNNIANILRGLQQGFEALGHQVHTFVKEPSPYYTHEGFNILYRHWDHVKPRLPLLARLKEKADYSRQQKVLKKALYDSIPHTDLYVFMWSSFMPALADLEVLRKHNKKIVVLFAGSEVRFSQAFAHEFNVDMRSWEEGLRHDDLNEKMYYTRMAELYSDVIFSSVDQSGLVVRPYNHFFLPVNVKGILYNPHTREVPQLIHAPTRTGAKGTEIFVSVVERLKNEGLNFEFSFFQNLKHAQLLELLGQADILLDELYFHGPGMLAAEAMASGCVAVTKTLNSCRNVFDPPVVSVTPDNLYTQLKQLIQDQEYRLKVKSLSRQYVEEKNEASRVCQHILDKINSGQNDYTPQYFLKHFDPGTHTVNAQNKKMTAAVFEKFHALSETEKAALHARKLI